MNDLSSAFASAFFFRLLFPGLTLAIGLHPLLKGLSRVAELRGQYPAGEAAFFLVEVVVLGLLAYGCTIPAYHVCQGLSLPWLTAPARLVNDWRLHRNAERMAAVYGDRERVALSRAELRVAEALYVYLSDFPVLLDDEGSARWTLERNTRAGNIIATYDTYVESRYGVDGAAYGHHILFLLPDSVRKELDSSQALATGMVLCLAASWVLLMAYTSVWFARLLGETLPTLALGPPPIPERLLISLTVYALLIVILFNYLVRVAHRDYGRVYRAAVDVNVSAISKWLEGHRIPLGMPLIERARALQDYFTSLDGEGLEPMPPSSPIVRVPGQDELRSLEREHRT